MTSAKRAHVVTRSRLGLLLYVVCAYGITWGIWAPYLWAARTGETPPSPFLYYLAAAGPLAGALVAELVERGAGGVRGCSCGSCRLASRLAG